MDVARDGRLPERNLCDDVVVVVVYLPSRRFGSRPSTEHSTLGTIRYLLSNSLLCDIPA